MLLIALLACRNKTSPDDTGVDRPDDCAGTWYQDADQDGFGADESAIQGCFPGTGWVQVGGDCQDEDAAVGPLMAEICDALDNDCDGSIDNDAVDGTEFYADHDADGFGDEDRTAWACRAPEDHVADGTDCDDDDPVVHPDADELCDELDNDCDGQVDEEPTDAQTWWFDADGDGDGGQMVSLTECEAPEGYVASSADCDDLDPSAYSGADETCDGVDNDCDGSVDEADALDAPTWYDDDDQDGAGDPTASTVACEGPSGTVDNDQDCDDADPDLQQLSFYSDADGDGFGDPSSMVLDCSAPSGTVEDATDCDDGEATAYPGSHETETPQDSIDTDCDGDDDCDDLNCDGWPDLVLPGFRDTDGFDDITTYVYYGSSTGYDSANSLELKGDGVRSALAQDLDGDGYVDLLLGSYRDDQGFETDSTVYWGSASGHSSSDATSLTGYGTLAVCAQDLDADGYDDVLLGGYYDGDHTVTSTLYWGSATGYNSTATTDLQGYGVRDCAIEDLDQDGYADLVLGSYAADSKDYDSSAFIYWGDSTASYSTSSSFSTHRNASLTLYDVDDDGYTDLLLPRYKEASNDWSTGSPIYYGSGFTSTDTVSGEGTWELEVSDFDQDGHKDLVACAYAEGNSDFTTTSTLWWGSTVGFTSSNTTTFPTFGCRDVDIADVDGDGWEDLLFANFRSSSSDHTPGSRVYYGSSTGFDGNDYDTLDGSYVYKLNSADLDGDGLLEILVGNYHDGTYETDSFIYWGTTTGYSNNDRTDLPGSGVWGEILVVGSL